MNETQIPSFKMIDESKIKEVLHTKIKHNEQQLLNLLDAKNDFSWQTLLLPLEEMEDELNKMWSPIAHLHAVKETEGLRKLYKECVVELTEYHTRLLQLKALQEAVKLTAEKASLNDAQQKVIKNELRDFHLAGVNLAPAQKTRFMQLQKNLTSLTAKFSENLLDAGEAWYLQITDEKKLAGLPKHIIELGKETALQKKCAGFVFTLDYACYSAVMKYLDDKDLRYQFYYAYVTRASEIGPNAGTWDNTLIMEEIVTTRQELAQCVGFNNFAAYSLATKMASSTEEVLDFLIALINKAKPFALKEIEALKEYAKKVDNIDTLAAWDIPYYSEKMRNTYYAISQEELRSYFPVDQVLQGMFQVANRLFEITIKKEMNKDVWHEDVEFFAIYDKKNTLRGYFYTDLYQRAHKREGAWMDDCRNRRILANGALQLPIAFLTCNFNRPINNKPAYLTHDDVQTLFHEFGHCLHHLLTLVDYAGVSGINGVPWDAVEFPSQFFELWCWHKKTLDLISKHEETGETVPEALFVKMLAAKNFHAGLIMLRQLEFALFDFRLHLHYDRNKGPQVQSIMNEVRKEVEVFETPLFNRFQHSFAHIFAGGYAAGYYSYKWAEVLSTDAFAKFEETDIFDRKTGAAFMRHILEQGGVYDPMQLFMNFRGRKPTIDALLKYNGLA